MVHFIYDSATKVNLEKVEQLHYRAAIIVSGAINKSNKLKVYQSLNWRSLYERRSEKKAQFMYKVVKRLVPSYVAIIYDKFRTETIGINVRHRREFKLPPHRSHKYESSPAVSCISVWTQIPEKLKKAQSLPAFKANYKKHHYNLNNKFTLTTKLTLSRKVEIKLNRLRSDLALRSDFYRHNFEGIDSPACDCNFRSQTKKHFLLDCPLTAAARGKFTQNLLELADFNYLTYFGSRNKTDKVDMILYGSNSLSRDNNSKIMKLTAAYIDEII